MTPRNQDIGRCGEEEASHYLTSHGFTITARNVRTPYGEIDIVARKNEAVYCFEVKTRTSDRYGKGYEAVNGAKLARMKRAAQAYVLKNELQNATLLIRVISVELDSAGRVSRLQDFACY